MSDNTNKKYWQMLAPIYAPFMESDKAFYEGVCDRIKPYLKSDMAVLELACGSGQLSFPLSGCVRKWTATDFSEKMIAQAKKRSTTDKIRFCTADATSLKCSDERFDGVVIANALHIMPNPEKAMAEIHRVLKPNGLLYAPTFLWVEGKASAIRKKLMSLTGFKTYREWNPESFREFIESFGFTVKESKIIDGGLAPVSLLIAVKNEI